MTDVPRKNPFSDIAPALGKYTDDVLFGDVWTRRELPSPRYAHCGPLSTTEKAQKSEAVESAEPGFDHRHTAVAAHKHRHRVNYCSPRGAP